MIVGTLAWPIAQGRVTQYRMAREPTEQPGRTYPVISEVGKSAICRVFVEDVQMQFLKDAHHADARAEGYESQEELWAAWRTRWRDDPDTWVIQFTVETMERPRWPARDSSHGYVYSESRALERVEAVSPHDQLIITKQSREVFMRSKDKELGEKLGPCRDMEERLVVLEREARRLRVDVRSEAKMAKQLLRRGRNPQAQMHAMEKKLRGRWAA